MMAGLDYFKNLAFTPESKVSLAEAALQIACDEYPDLDVPYYRNVLRLWSKKAKEKCTGVSVHLQLERLNEWLFETLNFSGNMENYYDPRNSFLNDVIERRTGIPISLSVIYLELAWSLGLKACGVGFPGHFLVRVIAEGKPLYVDAFHKGNIMTAEGCREFLSQLSEGEVDFDDHYLDAVSKKDIIARMLRNLKRIYLEMDCYQKLINIQNCLIMLNPGVAEEIRDSGIIHYQMKAFKSAMQDFETFLSMAPDSEDAEVIQQYLQILREYSSRLN
ncbi:MAG TPA: transglutaminase-like domain-containing protein [Acidobacteriota bacterium]|jgi:regulator of sirC expression with transglutaminase-like and TPR domain|nr:transglutaminase-like domain-containing protein [Acidobacteriota bacterium]